MGEWSPSLLATTRSSKLVALVAALLVGAAEAHAAPTAAPVAAPVAEPTRSVASTTPTSVAAAPAPASAADRCLAVDALTGLTRDEQRVLAEACRRHAGPPASLAPLLARIVARADWESSVLADLLAGGAPHQDLGPDGAAAARLKFVRDGLHGRLAACTPVHRALDAYFAARDAGDVPPPPFTPGTVADCLHRGPDALTGLAFLTIPADDPSATVFVAAAAGERVVLQWLGDGDAVLHRGRRIFVVAVPRWSVVTVRAGTPQTIPQQWHGFVTYHQTIWDIPPAAGCLRMSVDLDPDTTLLLDGQVVTRGQALAHRTLGVYAGAHTLAAVRCAGDTCAPRFRETLPPIGAAASENLCQDVALDLHQRRSVAILQARAAPGCDAALAWRAGQLASDHLRTTAAATGRSFRDLASYANITSALGSLRDGLNPTAGQAVGAATGSDSLDLVASVAKEAWRQGIDELVTLELRCSAGAELSLQATKISVREAFDRPLGSVAGLDLKNLMSVQSLGFTGEAQLPSTVAGLLDRLFVGNYLYFREGTTRFHYREPARLELVGHPEQADAGVEIEAEPRQLRRMERMKDAWRRSMIGKSPPGDPCSGGPRTRRSGVWISDEVGADGQGGKDTTSHHRMNFRVSHPGPYKLTAHWTGARTSYPGPCIEFYVPPRELWGSATMAPDITYRTPITALAARHFRFMVGHTWYLRSRPWFGYGIAGGYTYTRYASFDGVPAWQDSAADPAATHASLYWGRHAIVVGPLIEFRSRNIRLPVEFRARLSAGIGPAITNASKLGALPEFATPSRYGTSDLRLRWTLDTTAELGLSAFARKLAITPLIALGATALGDMAQSQWAISATGGAGLYLGFGIHLGGAP